VNPQKDPHLFFIRPSRNLRNMMTDICQAQQQKKRLGRKRKGRYEAKQKGHSVLAASNLSTKAVISWDENPGSVATLFAADLMLGAAKNN